MELHLADKSDKTIVIRIKGADITMIAPLVDKLNEDKNVEHVRYMERHPELEEPALTVTVIKGKPEDAVAKAAKEVADYFSGSK